MELNIAACRPRSVRRRNQWRIGIVLAVDRYRDLLARGAIQADDCESVGSGFIGIQVLNRVIIDDVAPVSVGVDRIGAQVII